MPVKYEFEIESDHGTVDVKRNGRAFAYDLDDIDEAMAKIRRSVGRGVKVRHWTPSGQPEILTT